MDDNVLLSVSLTNNTFNIHGGVLVEQEYLPKFICVSTSIGLFQWNIPFQVLRTEKNEYSIKFTLASGQCAISEITRIGESEIFQLN